MISKQAMGIGYSYEEGYDISRESIKGSEWQLRYHSSLYIAIEDIYFQKLREKHIHSPILHLRSPHSHVAASGVTLHIHTLFPLGNAWILAILSAGTKRRCT